MKTLRNSIYAMSLMAVTLAFTTSCSNEDEFIENVENTPQTEERIPRYATMKLDGGVVGFDNATRGSDEWKDGDKVYIQFTVGKSTVGGLATYSAMTTEWTVEYYGDLTEGVETKCEAYYFENTGKVSNMSVLLTEHSIIYEDKSASYMFENEVLKVSANLKPKTGRLKLKGEVGEKYRFSGVTYYNAYDILKNSFTTKEPAYLYNDSGLGKEGCTDYFYVFFSDAEKRELCFDDMEYGFSYVKSFGENALAVGRSGYLNIPSFNNRSGWSNLTKDITVAGVTFRMIRVLYENGGELPYFYIGETEVTQDLWESIMGANPSTFEGEDLPVNNLSGDDCSSFISKLNEKTKMQFRIPTNTEWEYAAQGGCASKGYSYSGSNNADEVGWHNKNSKGTPHSVKTKLPNEIGLYDMSGNVCEYIRVHVEYHGAYYTSDTYYTHDYEIGGGDFMSDISNSIGYYYLGKAGYYTSNNSDPAKYSNMTYNPMGLRIAIDDIE